MNEWEGSGAIYQQNLEDIAQPHEGGRDEGLVPVGNDEQRGEVGGKGSGTGGVYTKKNNTPFVKGSGGISRLGRKKEGGERPKEPVKGTSGFQLEGGGGMGRDVY